VYERFTTLRNRREETYPILLWEWGKVGAVGEGKIEAISRMLPRRIR
jgi:hypothetical protein